MIYLQLFYEFFKIGLFAVGGGLATIPFLYNIANTRGWFEADFIGTMIAIAESTPGPIGVNAATYAGFTTGGVLGGAVATLALICPSIIIIVIVSKILDKFRGNKKVEDAFYGIRPAVIGLIGVVTINMIQLAVLTGTGSGILGMIGIKELILFAVLLVATNKIKLHPIVWIIIAGAVGGIFSF